MPRQLQDLSAEIHQAMAGHEFDSLEEMNAFLGQFMQQRSNSALDDFQGLSPYQMHRLLSFPFDSPDVVTFADAPEGSVESPIMRAFALLVEAIGEKGIKPTATGNLPRNLVRELALAYWGEEVYRQRTEFGDLRSETECGDLHYTRVVSGLAGLIRKYKGKFVLSQKCRTLHAKVGLAGMYPLLFRAYATRFNWAYQSWSADVPLVQQSFLFTVYLLQRFGEQWRNDRFYEDAFLQAFPDTLDGFTASQYFTPEGIVRASYSGRALFHFAAMLGLAEVKHLGEPGKRIDEIRKLPLVDLAITFHVGDEE